MASSDKTPVSIITGFLGSGKTTLVNYILTENHGKKIAVVENEFGEVGIDDALVLQAQEEIFEMNNGCVCCSVRGDLIRILNKLAKRRNKFDHILIETTGKPAAYSTCAVAEDIKWPGWALFVAAGAMPDICQPPCLADPAPVLQTFFVDDDLQESFKLDALITVVDAKHIMQHLDEVKPEGVENESEEQVAFADRILLNKTDLVGAEEKAAIKDKIKLLGIQAFSLDRVLAQEPDFLEDKEHEHDSSISSVGIERVGACDMEQLQQWLGGLLREKGADLFRSKGVLAVQGSNDRYVFQGVHMLMQMTCSSNGDVQPWGPTEQRLNRIVFIGRNLDRDALTKSFEACLAQAGRLRSRVLLLRRLLPTAA
ncbi:CobW/HypB/UreG, nucleotide-binding domain-containing protein [Scenedesmus sp. NREL 46B-D3]|nr:CobW/HypB/UreG, nucleotide-binding domain-containing protein [Scenedesmus sp. NREL 46B-D3]